jgi:hypothetical protein
MDINSLDKDLKFYQNPEFQKQLFNQFLAAFPGLSPGSDGVIEIEQPYTLRYVFSPDGTVPNATETFQHGLLIPEDKALETGAYHDSYVMAMTRNTFVECFNRLQQVPDAVQTELFPKRPPEPFFTATIGGQEISFYTYTGDTGNYDASRVVEALREETEENNEKHLAAQAVTWYDIFGTNQQSPSSDTGNIDVPPPPEIPYKKYILFTPRYMFDFLNQNNPKMELTKA